MSNWTGNAFVVKAKSMFGKRLTKEDYQELTKKKSVSDIAGYLKTKGYYSEELQDVQEQSIHRGQLENLIRKTIFNEILRLVKFVEMKDKEFFELHIADREIDLILAHLRALISETPEESIIELPVFFMRHASFDIATLSRTKSISQMLEVLIGTPYYDHLLPYENMMLSGVSYPDVERELDHCFYDCAFRRISKYYSGRLRKQLETIFRTNVELSNIVKIYRMKKFYQAKADEIRSSVMTKYTRWTPTQLDELLHLQNAEDVLKYMNLSDLSKFADEDDYVFIEYYAERIKYHLAKRFMYFSYDAPAVYAAFLMLLEIERENLFNIIEGVRYGLSENEIEKILIYE